MKHILLLSTILMALILPGAGLAAVPEPGARLDAIITQYVAAKQFMGAVLVEQDGKILLDKAYGYANLEWGIPGTPDTKFRIGSITKQFTAAAILLLEERGKLRIDDPVKTHLPEAPASWDKVTIRHLLSHTSGIPDYTILPDFRATQGSRTKLENLVGRFRDLPLDFPAGTGWSYSNSGYVLLGWIIQRVSGQSYAAFLDENFFAPLEMADTGYDYNAVVLDKRASGYLYANGFHSNADYTDMSVPFAAGALYSTTRDLLRWTKALVSGKVLSATALRKMTTHVTNRYAMGLFSAHLNQRQALFHGGAIAGFHSELDYYPDSRLTVVVLGNLADPAATDIATNLAGTVLGRPVVLPFERREITLPPQVLADYVGVYRLDPRFTMTISLEGNRLMVLPTGQAKHEVYAETDTRFFFKDVEAQLVFTKNAKGEVINFVYTQDGNDTIAPRQ